MTFLGVFGITLKGKKFCFWRPCSYLDLLSSLPPFSFFFIFPLAHTLFFLMQLFLLILPSQWYLLSSCSNGNIGMFIYFIIIIILCEIYTKELIKLLGKFHLNKINIFYGYYLDIYLVVSTHIQDIQEILTFCNFWPDSLQI